MLIGLVGSAGRAIGVKVAADHLALVNARLDGQMLTSRTVPFDAEAADALPRLAEALTAYAVPDPELPPLLGVGVAVPGVVRSPDTGTVTADVLRWRQLPVGRHLRGVLGLPVVVENDVNALAVAEVLYGHGREVSDFLVLTIGRGIGMGLVTDGSIYRGGRGGAGEFGHVPIDPDGPTCECGRRGCLEALIGETALVRAARERDVLGSGQGLSALAEAIVSQQLNGRAAAAIFARVCALFPKPLDGPTPAGLLALPNDVLRGAGLSGSKLAALRDLAERSLTGEIPELDELAAMSDDEATAYAEGVWATINAVNLRENIAPTRARATLVLEKGPDHRIAQVALRRL